MTLLCARALSFSYGELTILEDCNLELEAGQKMAIVGASGSGKSTLLHLLAGLDTPQGGEVTICGEALSAAKDQQRTLLRNRYMGFVYQFHHLLGEFSTRENVAMPLLIRGLRSRTALQKADALLERVGLGARKHHRPAQLSGGERQRAAIARALINEPQLLLADEPTGNLDQNRAQEVFALMCTLISEHQGALLIVTHDLQLARQMDASYQLKQGQLVPAKL